MSNPAAGLSRERGCPLRQRGRPGGLPKTAKADPRKDRLEIRRKVLDASLRACKCQYLGSPLRTPTGLEPCGNRVIGEVPLAIGYPEDVDPFGPRFLQHLGEFPGIGEMLSLDAGFAPVPAVEGAHSFWCAVKVSLFSDLRPK